MRFEVTCEKELFDIIEKYDSVSFDIFDTLIMRKTLFPEDVFRIMENKLRGSKAGRSFADFRQRAILESDTPNPTIYEVYDKLIDISGLELEEKEKLIALEIEIEKTVLVRREDMVSILNRIYDMGKRVYLITDMYLPAKILVEILDKLDIRQYEDILVSCDYRTLKSEGLFDRFLEKYPSSSCLHIGDNLYSDIECAEIHGLDCVFIPSALHVFRASAYGCIEEKAGTLTERNMLGMFLAEMFNNPFERQGKRELDIRMIAGMFMNPVVYSMIMELKKLAEHGKYDAVLFASRDGYLLRELYNSVRDYDTPEGKYLYTSRKAAVTTDLQDEEQILWFASLPYEYGKEQILSEAFGLDNISYDEKKGLKENVALHFKEIRERSDKYRRNYEKYLADQHIGDGSYLFVDLVSSGTSQLYLEKLIQGQIEGYYLCKIITDEGKKENLKCMSLFEPVRSDSKKYGFNRIYYLFENVLTSYEPSLEYFDDFGEPVFGEETRTKTDIETIRRIHEDMRKYFQYAYYMSGEEGRGAPYFADELIRIFLDGAADIRNDFRIVLRDDWMNHYIVVDKI